MTVTSEERLYAALEIAKSVPIFPCKPDKTPLVEWKREATRDPLKIQAWWEKWPHALVAQPTGRSTSVVVDIDAKGESAADRAKLLFNGHPCPPTFSYMTRNGGIHLHYRHSEPVPTTASRIADKVDTRGEGGYVIRWDVEGCNVIHDCDYAPLPDWLFEKIAKQKEQVWEEGDSILEGSRNNYLARMAGAMRRPGFSADAIYNALLVENERRCRPPLADGEVRLIAESVGRYKPGDEVKVTAAAPEKDTLFHIISATDLSVKEFAPIKWAVEGLIPEGAMILAGAPKIGKSWLGLDLVLSVGAGGQVLKYADVEQGESLYLALEDNYRRLQRRMVKRLFGKQPPSGVTFSCDWPRSDAGGIDFLDKWLTKHPSCRVVVIDTMARFRPPQKVNGGLYGQDYEAVAGVQDLAGKHGCAIVMIHHTKKVGKADGTEDPLEMISGSLGLSGGVDNIMVMTKNRLMGGANLYVTGRDVPSDQTYSLEWDNEICSWAISGCGKESLLSPERRQIYKIIKDFGPIRGIDVCSMVHPGMDKKAREYETTRKRISRMATDGLILHTDSGFVIP